MDPFHREVAPGVVLVDTGYVTDAVRVFGEDLDLNAQGLECWLDAQAAPARG